MWDNDTGFYYDFEAEPFSREDLDNIEKEMKKIVRVAKPSLKIFVGDSLAESLQNHL